MDDNNYISTVEELISTTESLVNPPGNLILFRGQSSHQSLIPKVARGGETVDRTPIEQKMIDEFRRRLARERDIASFNDWDILVYAQHFGLATRLLDWTTNPLLALWFACESRSSSEGCVYLLIVKPEGIVDTSTISDPLNIDGTFVLKPNHNNSRVIAQSGWFTAHGYSKQAGRYEEPNNIGGKNNTILMKGIKPENKGFLLRSLDKLGVNQESVFPGPEGTAKYVNWLNEGDL